MEKYHTEIFKTLTSDQLSFSSAYEIYLEMPLVINKLIKEYWLLVKEKLEELAEGTFNIGMDENIEHTYSKLYLYLGDSKDFRFLYQHLHLHQAIGLWINYGSINQEKADEYRIEKASEFEGWATNSSWWMAFKMTNSDFTRIDSLTKILPENREEFAQQNAKELFDFAEMHIEHLTYLNEHCLK